MFTKNIRLKRFGVTKNKQKIKTHVLKKLDFYKQNKLIKSFSKNYLFDFNNNKIKRYKKYSNFNLIGMGGSSLGARAIYNFLKPRIKKNFSFLDNLNSRNNYQKKNQNINIIISKSGNTLETISNYSSLKDNNNNIFICENTNNYIKNLANKLNYLIINHKNYIGGRYSVLSEVGMLPAIFMGLNPEKFKNFNNLIKNKNFLDSLIDSVVSTSYFIKKKKI